ncbi:hypothetical protein DM02DRAFT_701043 [Periconia macrospinosa]|uniref:Uncharacterized protein n=1 Tax=Periconia macrospinosa TaxID=97972 RepID=A0A2V1D3N6_9PLEO|nr:hypothetical protein DM02DRAFT_701043 [Periconia macrospinosa]
MPSGRKKTVAQSEGSSRAGPEALELPVTNTRKKGKRSGNLSDDQFTESVVTPRKKTVAELTAHNKDLTQQNETLLEKIALLEKQKEDLEAQSTPTKKPRRRNLTISVPKFDPDGVGARIMATPISATPNTINGIIYRPTNSSTSSTTETGEATPIATLLTPFTARGAPTMMTRSPAHDLSSQLPPPNVFIPIMPLTDEEVIVFFYNSTIYPIVAMRLYGREWGPAKITEVINSHREVKPNGYIRNTCSVKITTALKRGMRMYGEEWKDRVGLYFRSIDDCEATDAMNLLRDKTHVRVDYPVLNMTKSLKNFPEGEAAGIFTKSLQWCAENNVNMLLSELHLVAIALDRGFDPITAVKLEDLAERERSLAFNRASPEDTSSEKTPTQSDYLPTKPQTSTDSSN